MEVTPNAARAWTFTRRQWRGVCGCASSTRYAARYGAGRSPPRSSRSSGTGSGSRAVRTSRWKRQVWQMLEGEFQLLLANPAHIRNVPGKKTGKENRPSRPVR
jgi:hypothetical protein